jgi:Family of unknown function (DUF6526)
MPSQNYQTHPHRPTLTIAAFACVLIGITGFVLQWRATGGPWRIVVGVAGLTAAILVLLSISRVYTTRLQDRIIRLEMRVRCAPILTPAQLRTLMDLDLRRIAAMRFASDGELPALLDRTIRESLTADQIKRAVTTWTPDQDRT